MHKGKNKKIGLLGNKSILTVNNCKGNVTFLTKKPNRWMHVKEPIIVGNETYLD